MRNQALSIIRWFLLPYMVMTTGLLGWYSTRSPRPASPEVQIQMRYIWDHGSWQELQELSLELFGTSPMPRQQTMEDRTGNIQKRLESLGVAFPTESHCRVPGGRGDRAETMMIFEMFNTLENHQKLFQLCEEYSSTTLPDAEFQATSSGWSWLNLKTLVWNWELGLRETVFWSAHSDGIRPQYMTTASVKTTSSPHALVRPKSRHYKGRAWRLLMMLPLFPSVVIFSLRKPLNRVFARSAP